MGSRFCSFRVYHKETSVEEKRKCVFELPNGDVCNTSLADVNDGTTCLRHPVEMSQPKSPRMDLMTRGKSYAGRLSLQETNLSPEQAQRYGQAVLEAVFRVFGVPVSELHGIKVQGLRLEARQTAIYFLYAGNCLSPTAIAQLVGMHRTSTYNSCGRIEQVFQRNDDFAKRVREVETVLQKIQVAPCP